MALIPVTDELAIDESAIELSFVRAGGPGGQNVNKVSTAVQLRFDPRRAGLPEPVIERLNRLAGRRLTAEGHVVLNAQRHRSQERNRADALDRLVELIRDALAPPPPPRRPTRPSAAARRRRLEEKGRRSAVKRLRGVRPEGGE